MGHGADSSTTTLRTENIRWIRRMWRRSKFSRPRSEDCKEKMRDFTWRTRQLKKALRGDFWTTTIPQAPIVLPPPPPLPTHLPLPRTRTKRTRRSARGCKGGQRTQVTRAPRAKSQLPLFDKNLVVSPAGQADT